MQFEQSRVGKAGGLSLCILKWGLEQRGLKTLLQVRSDVQDFSSTKEL